jgi:hypothetical protein
VIAGRILESPKAHKTARYLAEREGPISGPSRYFGPSGTNSAGTPCPWNQPTIASCGGFSIP